MSNPAAVGIRRVTGAALATMLVVAACGGGPGGGTPRPTDPRQILVEAVGATAAVQTLHLHIEAGATMGGFGMGNDRVMSSMDLDIDLATRQLAGRARTQMPGMPQNGIGNGQVPAIQVSDVIVTRTATFNRDSDTGRWRKSPGSGLGERPTNAEIGTMVSNLLSNPAVTFERADAGSCTLGNCDHVIAHIDGQTLAAALGPMLGMPMDSTSAQVIPSFDVDVLVDQATSVISELRTGYSMQGTTFQALLQVSALGAPVQISEPPAALTDDFGGFPAGGVDFGSGGMEPDASAILEQVGNEILTPEPLFSEPPSSAP